MASRNTVAMALRYELRLRDVSREQITALDKWIFYKAMEYHGSVGELGSVANLEQWANKQICELMKDQILPPLKLDK